MNALEVGQKIARLLAAGVAGYAVIVALTTLGFVHWLDGMNLYEGGARLQAQGFLVAVVAGLAGGSLAAWIGGSRPFLHTLAVLPFLIADTIYVLFFFPRTTPFWFELAGASGLIGATLVGGALVAWKRPKAATRDTRPRGRRGCRGSPD